MYSKEKGWSIKLAKKSQISILIMIGLLFFNKSVMGYQKTKIKKIFN